MKISNIKIKNFRSIEKIDIELDDFNIFVGQNNHGKTNIFEAINWFYSPKGSQEEIKRKGASKDEDVEVEITFQGVTKGIDRMKNEKNRTVVKGIVKDSDKIIIKRSSANVKMRSIYESDKQEWTEKLPTGFDNSLNDLLPKLEYVRTQTNLKDIVKYGKNTPIAEMLSGVLEIILEENEHYRDFKDKFDELFRNDDSEVKAKLDSLSNDVRLYLVKQFSECTKVEFSVKDPIFEDLLKNFETKVDDGVETSAEEKGDGMQRALMLAIIQTYADFRKKKGDTTKNFIFLIDEGELHLHPTAQRKLKDSLADLSQQGDQVLINTHSSVLVVDEKQNQSIYKVEKNNKITIAQKIKEDEKPYIVYELLGGSPADLLLPNNFLIVEGKSDCYFIRKVIERFYADKVDIQIIYSEGDYSTQKRTLDGVNKVLVPLFTSPMYKDKLILLCEAPSDEAKKGYESFKNDYRFLVDGGQLFEIPEKSIEEYYPSPWKKTSEEVKQMTSDSKIKLAIKAGEEISKEIFEKDMQIIHKSLSSCWDKAFS